MAAGRRAELPARANRRACPKPGAAQTGPTKGALGLLLSRKTMWGQFITQGCCAYTMYLFLAWLPSYLVRERHMDLMKASWFTAMPYLMSWCWAF